MQSADHLRAHFSGLSYEAFIARRDLLRAQAEECAENGASSTIVHQDRRERVRRRVARFLLPFAGLLTFGRFSRKWSLLLDRIITQAEQKC